MRYEPHLIAQITRASYETFAVCSLHFALLAVLLVSVFRRHPECPRWLWFCVAAGYSVLGLVLLRVGVGVASEHTAETIINPTPIILLFILVLLVGWIVPAVILSVRIARYDSTKVA